MSFDNWWERNKDLYGLVSVTKQVAKAIWGDAIQSVETPVFQQIKELMQTLEDEK
jgi:hypothetical protein